VIELGAVADALAEDGQEDKAGKFEGRAASALADQLDKWFAKQKQTGRFAVATR